MDRLLASTPNYEALLDDVVQKRNNPHDAALGLLSRVQF
jgi:hypothetical protein